MENIMALTGLIAVTLVSLPVALGLVWLGLVGAFRLLPNAPRCVRAAARPTALAAGFRWAVVNSKGLPRAFRAGLER
jgi:hypothetical protein